MNWKECVHVNEADGIGSRFAWPMGSGKSGFDCNEATTFNDIWGAVSWVWTYPGDYLLNSFFGSETLQTFFEFEHTETIVGSWWSTVFIWAVFIYVGVKDGLEGS